MEKEKSVVTISKINALEAHCRLIDGEYYLIGNIKIENSGDVYQIGKRFIRTDNLVYNHSLKEYTLPSNSLISGVVDFNKEEPIFGYFEKNLLYNVNVFTKDEKVLLCLNKTIVPLYFREEKSTGIFFHISIKKARYFNLLTEVPRELKESFPYDSRGITKKYTDRFEKNYKPNITENVKKYSPLLKNYTFGLEFETIRGYIPDDKMNILPLIPLRDGSISGLEYVTTPLKGELGLQATVDSVSELNNKTEYDTSCALHYHIGNIPRTPEFILAFYKTISFFQDEIFSMFPLYKKYNFGVKRKNYSKPFPFNKINSLLEPSIDIKNSEQVIKNFNVIFKYLSEGYDFSDYSNNLDNVKEHPRDPHGNQKWNINTR